MRSWNRRQRALGLLLFTAVLLLAVTVSGALLTDRATAADFSRTNLAPGPDGLFGTDWLGRDMLSRTLAGLSLSIRIGALTACVSAVIALALGVAAALSRWADAVLSWLIDLFLGIPHILLVMLISLACGRGFLGVVAGVSLSHWPSLARLVREEVLQLRQAPYLLAAEKLGLAFVDTDERIERASGRTIPEIFASEGEEGFRARELDVSRALAREGGLVIACGGGLPTRAEAIAALKASGVVFWLSREPAVIYDTVSMARRPLGQGGKEAFLERFRQREPIYRRWADYIIEGHTQAAEAAGRIAALYERECQA